MNNFLGLRCDEVNHDSRGYPGPPKSRLGRMLKAGIPRHIAFPLEIALNKATDPETTSHMNKAATEHDDDLTS